MRKYFIALSLALLVSQHLAAQIYVTSSSGGAAAAIAERNTLRNTNSVASTSSLGCSTALNVNAGDLVVMTGGGWPTTGFGTPAGSSSGTGMSGATTSIAAYSGVTGNNSVYVLYAFATGTGTATLTVTPTSNAWMSCEITAFTGLNQSSVLDANGGGATASSAAPTDAITTNLNGSLIVNVSSVNGATPTVTANSPWTLFGQVPNNSTAQASSGSFYVAGAAGTYTPDQTVAPNGWSSLSLAFRIAASSGGSGTPLQTFPLTGTTISVYR